ncbi:MAG TPA: DEAD/DEAH box helicase [Actinomycetota bacterium]|nr:DEAD/DEAH box helicase [Actinomycetota bacterium]
MTLKTFAQLGVSEPVAEALAARDILMPFAIQALALPDGLAGHDILAKSRTGSGKTLAFGIPLVERIEASAKTPAALVLVPTRELASQVAEELESIAAARGLRVGAVYGGTGVSASGKTAARAHILIATPGRMEDLANRRMVALDNVQILVLDEADRMLDMGFAPQVDKIVKRLPEQRQTMFFSATLDGTVGSIARAYTYEPRRHEVETPTDLTDDAEHKFVPVTEENKLDALIDLIGGPDTHALVFVRTKRGADRLAEKLVARGVPAEPIHGDLRQSARERALSRFDERKVSVLIATDVAARGLDVDGITHVINYDPPGDDKGYVHRIGRTARAGKSGTGITFVLPTQTTEVSRMAARLNLHEEFEMEGMKVAPPQLVYKARRGKNSLLGKRPRRRF